MNYSPFQSPDVWKSALLTLPDTSYFELMRSVFGNVKTPFNKQRLVEDLAVFLSRKEIQETVALYIDETDAKIIAAIATLEEPAPGELETFFAGEFSYGELHSILLNLEERLILYRYQSKDARGREVRHISLNPLLEPILVPIIADKGSLFPSQPLDDSGTALDDTALDDTALDDTALDDTALDDRLLAALFAFAAGETEFFKAEGGIRKKILDDGRNFFPGLDLESLIGGLQALGLLQQHEEGLAGGLAIDESKLRYFKGLSFTARREYIAAGICIDKNPPKTPQGAYSRGRLQTLVRLIHTVLDTLRPDRQYPKSTLKRIADILERGGIERANPYGRPWAASWGADTGVVSAPGVFDTMLEALQIVGLLGALTPGEAEGRYVRYPPREAKPSDADSASSAVIAMDTAFSCILYPEICFEDALELASFSMVRETGTTVRFEMTRESVVRGFDRGLDADTMLSLLDRLSLNQVEQNLRWTLKDWETRYAGVSLYQGLVLTLAEDRRYLAEAEPVASLVARTVAPGVYLLSASERAGAIQTLHRAGIDIVAQPSTVTDAVSGEWRSPYPAPESAKPYKLFPEADAELSSRSTEKAEQYKERFRTSLGGLSLTKAERDELTARIERRLILNESQLVGISVRYEKLEARGLDYVGKTSIAKQAITAKQLIEIMWANPDGAINRVVGKPEALEKSGGDTLLVLTPVPGGTPDDVIRLPLGKISLLRRIKQSIFGE
ncbi:helicase [Spirochaetia bacterium]|nr:helicase [Spirochaetia bacterium]